MNNDEITNKILESGFIEAFFEQYFQHLDWEYTEKENVEIILCTSNKEKQKVIKQLIKGYKEKIRLLGFNSLSSNFLENTNIDAHLEFISFIKSSIESFKPINMFLNQISNGMQSSNNDLDLENIYLFNYPNEWKPKSKKLFEILEQERFLIEDINIIISKN